MFKLKLPGLSPAVSSFVLHIAVVFLATFGTALTAGATNAINISTLYALLYSSAAAGIAAAVHYVLGFVPTPVVVAFKNGRYLVGNVGVSLKVESRLYQTAVSVVVTFLSIFGSSLVAGAAGVTSLPSIIDLITAAIAAGVSGVVSYVVGLVPAPKATA